MNEIFHKVIDELIDKEKRVIGINGVDTSGKTFFTNNLAQFLTAMNIKNEIINIDDFHNPLEIRRQGENEIDAYYGNAFNYNQVICEILKPLRDTGNVDKEVICLNLDTDKYENVKRYCVDKETVLLIEGVLLFRPPIAEYLDGKIFLHIDFDEVMRRAEIRDAPKYGAGFLDKYITKYIPIQKRYLREYQPEKNCDIFIDNNDYFNPR